MTQNNPGDSLPEDLVKRIAELQSVCDGLQNTYKSLSENIILQIDILQKNLAGVITTQPQALVRMATDGLDDLPLLIQQRVEAEIDRIDTLKQLRAAGDCVRSVAKNVVMRWLEQNTQWFQSIAEGLQRSVETGRVGKLQVPGSLWSAILCLLGRATLASGVGLVAGLGTAGIIAWFMEITAWRDVPRVLSLLPFGTAAFPVVRGLYSLKEDIRKRFKRNLSKFVPGNTVNAYQAIVEGCQPQSGQYISGVRAAIMDTLKEQGVRTKNDIS